MTRPRVLFTDAYPAHVGGAQRTLADLATGVSERFEVSAATVADGAAAQHWRTEGLRVHVVEYPPALRRYQGALLSGGVHRRLATAGAVMRHAVAAARVIRRERIDVVYCSNVRSMLSFGLAARLLRRPTVLYVQQLERDFARSGRVALRLSTRILTLSDRWERAFPQGVPADRVRVVPLGIDLAVWTPSPAPTPSPRPTSIDDTVAPAVIACVGAITREKGLDVVIGALARLRTDHDVSLRLVGAPVDERDQTYAAGLRRTATEAGVADAIEWWGETDDVRAALDGVTVFVSGSRREGTPRSIMEAMALGLPTVATDVGAVSDLVVDDVTGLVVPPDHVGALAAAIVRLIDDPATARRMGTAAREHALAHLDLADTIAAFADEFDALVERRGR